MASTLGKSQEGEEEKLTVPDALDNDNRKGNMGLLNLCVMFTCIILFRYSYASMFKIQLLRFYHICHIYIIIIHRNI